jgi:hypothetical protein
MPSPFSRTMRSLHADSFRPALIGLIVATFMLVIWCLWFFFAQVSLYEKSLSARITKGEIITAEFPAESLHRIQQKQEARLQLDGIIGQQVGPVRAIVTDILKPSQTETTGQVKLFAFAEADSPIRFEEELTGQVEIEVEHLSPAQLVMQVSGLF